MRQTFAACEQICEIFDYHAKLTPIVIMCRYDVCVCQSVFLDYEAYNNRLLNFTHVSLANWCWWFYRLHRALYVATLELYHRTLFFSTMTYC